MAIELFGRTRRLIGEIDDFLTLLAECAMTFGEAVSTYLDQGASERFHERLAQVQERLGVPPEATVSMGDDLPDLGLALRSAVFACPADARPEVREQADLVTTAAGGAGAVRELIEAILRSKELWEPTLDRYGPTSA